MRENKKGLVQINPNARKQQGACQNQSNARKQAGACPNKSKCTKASRGLSKSIKMHENNQGLVQNNQNARKQAVACPNQNIENIPGPKNFRGGFGAGEVFGVFGGFWMFLEVFGCFRRFFAVFEGFWMFG